MKRFRVVRLFFNSEPMFISRPNIPPEAVVSDEMQEAIKQRFSLEYGQHRVEEKLDNYAELGSYPFSILGYHTLMLEQIRRAFISFGYYPALTGACALGERILNHMVLKLRGYFVSTPEYKSVAGKSSFDDWHRPLKALESWGVLLPEVVTPFHELRKLRNKSVHFTPGLEADTRTPALQAIRLVTEIIGMQFSAAGAQPWFLPIPGEMYISKEAEAWPFVKEFYLPACQLVGPRHQVVHISAHLEYKISDPGPYEDVEITDEEFARLRALAIEQLVPGL